MIVTNEPNSNAVPPPASPKNYALFTVSIIVGILAIPIIIFLGFLATVGIFAAAPDALLIPSLVGLAGGLGVGIWKFIQCSRNQIS